MRRKKYFTKQQADRLLWKIYKNIKEKTATLELDKTIPVHAYLYYDPNRIIINPKKPIIHAFVHEYLHIFYPNEEGYLRQDDYENWILDMEDELVDHHWSMRQLENILKRMGSLL